MSKQGAVLQTYNNELIKCKVMSIVSYNSLDECVLMLYQKYMYLSFIIILCHVIDIVLLSTVSMVMYSFCHRY